MPIDPEIGFTTDVIRDPSRFIGQTELVNVGGFILESAGCISALNVPTGSISVYDKRGVGKSSFLRSARSNK